MLCNKVSVPKKLSMSAYDNISKIHINDFPKKVPLTRKALKNMVMYIDNERMRPASGG